MSKYALVIPRGGGDNRTAYSIEQYVSTLHDPFLYSPVLLTMKKKKIQSYNVADEALGTI